MKKEQHNREKNSVLQRTSSNQSSNLLQHSIRSSEASEKEYHPKFKINQTTKLTTTFTIMRQSLPKERPNSKPIKHYCASLQHHFKLKTIFWPNLMSETGVSGYNFDSFINDTTTPSANRIFWRSLHDSNCPCFLRNFSARWFDII